MPIDTDLVRRSISLVDIISRHVKLRRHGDKSASGLCPFHAEKTPSFYVYPEGNYHCFGCGEHGDCFSWVMKIDGVDFLEAARRLGGDEIDGKELCRREFERRRERAERIAEWKADHPWTYLQMVWEREQADLWLAEIGYMREFRASADYHYLNAQWERGQ